MKATLLVYYGTHSRKERGDDWPSKPHPHRDRLRAMRREKVDREQHFGCELFGNSAWDIILALYAAALDGEQILVSRVGEVSGISQTTALRWLERLSDNGLVERVPHPTRGRHIYVAVTDRAIGAMAAYLDQLEG